MCDRQAERPLVGVQSLAELARKQPKESMPSAALLLSPLLLCGGVVADACAPSACPAALFRTANDTFPGFSAASATQRHRCSGTPPSEKKR